MSSLFLARRSTILSLIFFCALLRAEPKTESQPGADDIVGRVIQEEDINYEQAKYWEFEQHLVIQRLDSEGGIKSEKTKTFTYRPEGKLSFSVGGLKDRGENTDVGIGMMNQKDDSEEGKFSESIRMRELRPLYLFKLAGESEINGRKAWLLDFEPREGLEVEGEQKTVLSHLRGHLWIDQQENAISRAECSLVRPMPFAWFDLVSLRELNIQYETFLWDHKVWLPKKMQVDYLVRILFVSHIRERQMMTADGFRKIHDMQPPINQPK